MNGCKPCRQKKSIQFVEVPVVPALSDAQPVNPVPLSELNWMAEYKNMRKRFFGLEKMVKARSELAWNWMFLDQTIAAQASIALILSGPVLPYFTLRMTLQLARQELEPTEHFESS